jgi:hypothetical protein
MVRGPRQSTAAGAAALALLVFAQCQRQEAPRPEMKPAAATGGAPAVAAAPPAAPAPAADAAAAADGAEPPASKGTWLDGTIYRFRLDDVRKCPPPGAGSAARIGAVVRVTSKVNELLAAPRDVKLESDGVILESANIPKGPPGCTPLLAPASLRAGKTADGIVLFDIPPGFNPARRPVKLTYQPTRWGGAKRVEALVPPEVFPQ